MSTCGHWPLLPTATTSGRAKVRLHKFHLLHLDLYNPFDPFDPPHEATTGTGTGTGRNQRPPDPAVHGANGR
ncbi:hypothetical protein E6O75_ATG02866 [Venturia nashicola]|uniref:Uncharacterized protein n=1 Tax=Venturia nashicola TaxID=86259 RepID=A0A4Z1PGR2_9PEZI|nr:hypothetical protein E6O75_ATG02866 [Venturia nashicola]